MTANRMTVAEARALGLLDGQPVKAAKVKVRRTARGPYFTTCTACGMEFFTQASEDRHLNETGHHRYEIIAGYTKGT